MKPLSTITELDKMRLLALREASYKCTKCHGRDDNCECNQALRLKSWKISFNIPLEYRNLTFEDFKAPLLRAIIQQLKAYVKRAGKPDAESLYLYGGAGTGKSGLGCVILNKMIEQGYRCYFTTLPFYLERQRENKNEDFDLGLIDDASFLLLDDLNTVYFDQAGYVKSRLETLLEYRALKGTPTIITGSQTPELTFRISASLSSKIKQYYRVYKLPGKADHRDTIQEEKFGSEEKKLKEEEKKIISEGNTPGAQ